MAERVTELRIEGLRSIERLRLPLQGVTVLIGENGSGKSSIIEACEILRAAARPEFSRAFHGVHGGLFSLLRRGSTFLSLGARIEGALESGPVDYEIVLVEQHGTAVIHSESFRAGDAVVIERREGRVRELVEGSMVVVGELQHFETILGRGLVGLSPRLVGVQSALQNIEVHLPFEAVPVWAARRSGRRSVARAALPIQQADRVDLFGDNLANAYFALAHDFGEQHWQETLDYVRLGLGQHVERVTMPIDPGGGAIGLALEVEGRGRVSASALSDGELAYLAFVALYRLESPRSLLAFDEPDLHLHPGLLVRIVQFFQAMSAKHPVLLATHSDTVLDCVEDPVRSVRVCELEEPQRRTTLRSLDATALASWLTDYRGVGHVRGEGYLSQALKDEQ